MRCHKLTRWAAVVPVLALLTACSGLLDSKQLPDRTFLLSPYSVGGESGPGDKGLSLDFTVIPGLDSDKMLTLSTDAELSNLADVRWPDHLPEFVGSLLRLSLQRSGRYTKVSDKRSSALSDCRLELEAQQFYTLLDAAGRPVEVSIAMTGLHECDGKLTPIELQASTPVSTRQAAAIVAAHQSAMNEVTASLYRQLQAIENDSE